MGALTDLAVLLALEGVYLALVLPRLAANWYPVGDQSAYLEAAASLRLAGHLGQGFSYLYPEWGWRAPFASYLPLTAVLVAPLAGRDLAFFLRARLVLAGLGGVGIAVAYALGRRKGLGCGLVMGGWLATNAAYVGLAAHVLPDALLAAVLVAMAWLALEAGAGGAGKNGVGGGQAEWAEKGPLESVGAWDMLKLGLLGGLAWLIKASGLVVTACFGLGLVGSVPARRLLGLAGALVAGFAWVAGPYMVRNVKLLGNPIHDHTSAHLAWLEQWKAEEGGACYPYSAATRPSLGRYLRRHGLSGLARRTAGGLRMALAVVRRATLPAGLPPSRASEWASFGLWACLLALGIRVWGWGYGVKAVLLAAGVLWLGLACVGHATSFHVRFALPIVSLCLPLVAAAVTAGAEAVGRRWVSRWRGLRQEEGVDWTGTAVGRGEAGPQGGRRWRIGHAVLAGLVVGGTWGWARMQARPAVAALAEPLPAAEAAALHFLATQVPPQARVYLTSRLGCWRYLYNRASVIIPNFSSLRAVTKFADQQGIGYWVIDKEAWAGYPWLGQLPGPEDGWVLVARCADPDPARTILIYERRASAGR
jgi:hypothetical protein